MIMIYYKYIIQKIVETAIYAILVTTAAFAKFAIRAAL